MTIPFFTANRHLGDTLGVFLDSVYTGLTISFPFTVTWADETANSVEINIKTSNVETFQNLKGHPVFLDGQEIGRIKDRSLTPNEPEITSITVARADFADLFVINGKGTITISVETEGLPKGLADDFILHGASTAQFSARLGW